MGSVYKTIAFLVVVNIIYTLPDKIAFSVERPVVCCPAQVLVLSVVTIPKVVLAAIDCVIRSPAEIDVP